MPALPEEVVGLAEITRVFVAQAEMTLPGENYVKKTVDTVVVAIGLIDKEFYRTNPDFDTQTMRNRNFTLEQLAEVFNRSGALKDSEDDDSILVHKYLLDRFPDFFSGE